MARCSKPTSCPSSRRGIQLGAHNQVQRLLVPSVMMLAEPVLYALAILHC
jgi:hypothetical protein